MNVRADKTVVARKRKRTAAVKARPVTPVEQSRQQLTLNAMEEHLIADFRRIGAERKHMVSKFIHGCMVREVERASKVAPRFVLIQGGVR